MQGKGAAVGHAETRPQDLEPGPKEEPRELRQPKSILGQSFGPWAQVDWGEQQQPGRECGHQGPGPVSQEMGLVLSKKQKARC